MIDQDNNQAGIIDTHQALQIALNAGLDLVEVAPTSRPPVCRIMDYGKWKYQQSKKDQKTRSNTKQRDTKEVRVRPKTDEHDAKIKTDRARKFLLDGHKVQFTMLFRGREMAHRDIGFNIFREIAKSFEDIAKLENPPRAMGRKMNMLLAPVAGNKGKSKPKPQNAKEEKVKEIADEPAVSQAVEKEDSDSTTNAINQN